MSPGSRRQCYAFDGKCPVWAHMSGPWSPAEGTALEGCGSLEGRVFLEEVGHWRTDLLVLLHVPIPLPTACLLSASGCGAIMSGEGTAHYFHAFSTVVGCVKKCVPSIYFGHVLPLPASPTHTYTSLFP